MTKTIRLDYYGMEGAGRTVTEARQDAGRKIRAALEGNYTPEIVEWRGYAVLVFREPGGWAQRLIRDPEGLNAGPVHACPNHAIREEAIAQAKAHVAGLGWTHEDSDEPPDFLTSPSLRAEFRIQVEFYRRFKRARDAGLSDHDAHGYAGRDPSRPELIARVDGAPASVA